MMSIIDENYLKNEFYLLSEAKINIFSTRKEEETRRTLA
jgi:hypothetical protein